MNSRGKLHSKLSEDKISVGNSTNFRYKTSCISHRAFLLGLFLVAITCFIVSYAELVIGRIQIGFLQMPPAAIGIFFFIIIFNKLLRKIATKFALNSAELIMIYCMMIVAAMICSRGVLEKVIPLLVTPNYFANSSNRWSDLFYPHIKEWLVPFDTEQVHASFPHFVSLRGFVRVRLSRGLHGLPLFLRGVFWCSW